nr:hypothetical protein [Tanacetum cinerariifolium]
MRRLRICFALVGSSWWWWTDNGPWVKSLVPEGVWRKESAYVVHSVSDEVLGTRSHEFRRTVSFWEVPVSDEILGTRSREFRRTGSFWAVSAFLSEYSSFRDVVVSKFDMHVYTSVLTFDEVKNLIAKYAIPLDLHLCVPPSSLTMNRLPADKIGVRVGKGTALAVNGVISQHTTLPLPSDSQISEKSDHQRVVEYENKRVLAAKRKAQAAKDRAVGKRAAIEGASQRTKKKKTTPLSFALSESKEDGSGTHHSASPLNIIIPNEVGLAIGGGSVILEPVNREEEGTEQRPKNVEDTTEANSPLFENSYSSQHSNPFEEDAHDIRDETAHTYAYGSTGRSRSSLRGDTDLPVPFVPAWNLTTRSILNDTESCRDMLIHLATSAVRDQQNRLIVRYCPKPEPVIRRPSSASTSAPRLCREGSKPYRKLAAVEKERDNLLDKDQEREERTKQLEAYLANKTSFLAETERVVNTLKGDLERLSGVKATCSKEEAGAFLDTAVNYDPACKDTFMTEFDSLFNKSYRYVEKLAESFWLPLGDLQNMWPEGTGPTLSGASLGHWLLDSSKTSYVLGKVRHLAIGSWTRPRHLMFWVRCVTWPLALGLTRDAMRFEQGASLGHWLMDSSRTPCAMGKVRRLTIGSWTHPKRLTLRGKVRHLAIGSWTHLECETLVGIKLA